MNPHPDFLAQLGIRYPIIQAPMAGVSTPRLAAEVANAGAPRLPRPRRRQCRQARAMLEEARSLTARPFNANLFCHVPATARSGARSGLAGRTWRRCSQQAGIAPPAQLDEIYKSFLEDEAMLARAAGVPPAGRELPLRPAARRSARGLARGRRVHHGDRDQRAGSAARSRRPASTRSSPRASKRAATAACSTRTRRTSRYTTAVLVRLLVEASRLPIVAAGGIMDGAGIKAMLDLGAAAAQLGTAFILCPESSATRAHRANLQERARRRHPHDGGDFGPRRPRHRQPPDRPRRGPRQPAARPPTRSPTTPPSS